MKQQKYWFKAISTALIALTVSATAWADIHYNQRLPDWGDSGTKTVDFTNVEFRVDWGKTSRDGTTADSSFTMTSSADSTFSLNSPVDGYINDSFNGTLVVNATVTSRGIFLPGATFAIYSTDSMFGTDHTVEYDCNKSGKNCSSAQLVYGGELTAFGWHSLDGILEFAITNINGWTTDTWGRLENTTEHVLLNTQPFDLHNFNNKKPYTVYHINDGFAVVPDPATVVVIQTLTQ